MSKLPMQHYICVACGAQYAASVSPPEFCRICVDERQPYPTAGQSWITSGELADEHCNRITPLESGLFSIRTEPEFAIGQSAYLVHMSGGNILWDCLNVLETQTIEGLNELGGVQAIALSHPHFYGSAVDWSRALGDAPVYVHEEDREWILRPDPCFRFWTGERLRLGEGVMMVHCGGHFPGSSVLHWPQGADGRGVLLVSDTIYVCPDGLWASFMRSYPCYVPLGEAAVGMICDRIRDLAFDRVYGAFETVIQGGAATKIERSAARYIASIRGEGAFV